MRDYYGKPLKDELLEFANKLAVDYMLRCRSAWKIKLAIFQDNYDRCHELFAPFFIDHKSLLVFPGASLSAPQPSLFFNNSLLYSLCNHPLGGSQNAQK
jgi:hypothetical protein